MTMPAPPPYGVSSTVRWRSWVKSRRSWTCRSIRWSWRALPINERSSGERYSGKMVTTSSLITGSSRLGQVQQSGGRVEHDATTPDVDLGHDRRHERDQDFAAIGQSKDQQVLGGPGLQGSHLTDLDAADRHDLEPDQIPLIPGFFFPVVGQDVSQELDAAQRFGTVAVVGVLEAEQEDAVVVAGAAQDQRTGFRGAGHKERAGHEPLVRGARENLHGHLTAQSVRLANTSDDNLHGPVLQKVMLRRSVDQVGLPEGDLPAGPLVGHA